MQRPPELPWKAKKRPQRDTDGHDNSRLRAHDSGTGSADQQRPDRARGRASEPNKSPPYQSQWTKPRAQPPDLAADEPPPRPAAPCRRRRRPSIRSPRVRVQVIRLAPTLPSPFRRSVACWWIVGACELGRRCVM
jgi:hypothetical protein